MHYTNPYERTAIIIDPQFTGRLLSTPSDIRKLNDKDIVDNSFHPTRSVSDKDVQKNASGLHYTGSVCSTYAFEVVSGLPMS